jgi:hypothetical protein
MDGASMKKLLLTSIFFIGSFGAAFATCTGPAVMHDFPGTSFNMSLATNAGDGNCSSNVTIVGDLPAFGATPTVTANAGTNLNTSLLAIESGGNLASLVAQLGAVTASPTANTVLDRLKTINTTLGTPFQAGGSIGNTTFAVTNTGTFAVQATLTAETTKVIGTVNQGTSPWVTSATQSGTWNIGTVTTLPALVAGSAIVGKVGIDQTTNGTTNAVRVIAGTTGGATTAGAIQPNNTTAVVVKASAGTLYGAQLGNIGSSPAYLKIYNATSATCGSGTPVKRLIIPKAGTAADGGGSNPTFGDQGVAFGTGITYCVTTGIGDSDTTAAAANTVLVNLDYQ